AGVVMCGGTPDTDPGGGSSMVTSGDGSRKDDPGTSGSDQKDHTEAPDGVGGPKPTDGDAEPPEDDKDTGTETPTPPKPDVATMTPEELKQLEVKDLVQRLAAAIRNRDEELVRSYGEELFLTRDDRLLDPDDWIALQDPILAAAREGHIGTFRALAGCRPPLLRQDVQGRTAIHIAAMNDSAAIIEALLKPVNGKSVVNVDELSGNTRRTPLHFAAENGSVGVMEVLIREGANVNALSGADATPLMLAVSKGHRPAIEILIRANADLNVVGKDRDTALHIAAAEGDERAVELLVRAGADTTVRNRDRRTPREVWEDHFHTHVPRDELDKLFNG
ncbi:MAG: ankyrin repeat domain-containing protein, partial [Candidatus Eisenbacteria bacterium]|nr:ankyrin repeat domain-containing protein [Candidatus Eisenbacteria bacterium]